MNHFPVRVIFVGIHFKPKMKALDSRTKTGYVIDEIIEGLDVVSLKRNLFPTNHLPKGEEKEEYKTWFLNQVDRDNDQHINIYVLLGGVVQRELKGHIWFSVNLMHPGALRFGHDPKEYVDNAIIKIQDEIEKHLHYHSITK